MSQDPERRKFFDAMYRSAMTPTVHCAGCSAACEILPGRRAPRSWVAFDLVIEGVPRLVRICPDCYLGAMLETVSDRLVDLYAADHDRPPPAAPSTPDPENP